MDIMGKLQNKLIFFFRRSIKRISAKERERDKHARLIIRRLQELGV